MQVDKSWLALFDTDFYLGQYPDAASSPGGPIAHFREFGWAEDLSPHPLFSTKWYRRGLTKDEDLYGDPLCHYIEKGAARGIDPHPLFLTARYCTKAGISGGAPTALHHFLDADPALCASPHWLFDIDAYRALYPDCRQYNPLYHYVRFGEDERRLGCIVFAVSAHRARFPDVPIPAGQALAHFASLDIADRNTAAPLFDRSWYLEALQSTELETTDPLRHFLEKGCFANLSPHPLFDTDHYLRINPDIDTGIAPAFWHFALYGAAERRTPHRFFATRYYAKAYPDVAREWANPWAHYIAHGAAELRNPHPLFDMAHYVASHPEAGLPGINPLLDYLSHPPESRRHPHPLFDRLHQQIVTAGSSMPDCDPLAVYLEERAGFDTHLVDRIAMGSMTPRRARLPPLVQAPANTPVLADRPLVSIIIPTYETQETVLQICIASIIAQDYETWELIFIDDGSLSEVPRNIARDHAARDPRFTALSLPENKGISAATNLGLEKARGEYIALIDHDDLLQPHALRTIVTALIENEADVAYSDQNFITERGIFDGEFHKPAWSPTLFAGVMYIGHLLLVRRSVAILAGGFDPAFDRVQDYEFMLRVSEITDGIVHVPHLLYGWRRIPGSIAHDAGNKGDISGIQAGACQAHLDRIGIPATAVPLPDMHHRIRLKPRRAADRTQFDLIQIGHHRVDGDIVDMGGFQSIAMIDPGVPDALAVALAQGKAPYIVCWDIRIAPLGAWLDHIALYLEQDGVATSAPHLIRNDGQIVAAGMIANATLGLIPAMVGARYGSDGYGGSLVCDREVSALASPLMGVNRRAMIELDGIDRDYRSMGYALGDLAYRAMIAGWRNIAIGERLVEVSAGFDLADTNCYPDQLVFTHRHRSMLAMGDRYYNGNFKTGIGRYEV